MEVHDLSHNTPLIYPLSPPLPLSSELDMDSEGMSSLSPEVRNAPYDLHRYIVEQQYSEAVKLIVNMRAYHRDRLNATVSTSSSSHEKSPSHGEGSASLLALGVLMKRIEVSTGQLAETLMDSMAEALPGRRSCVIHHLHCFHDTLLRYTVNPHSLLKLILFAYTVS